MPIKMKKQRTRIIQSISDDTKKTKAGVTSVSKSSARQSGEPTDAPSSVDLRATPTEDISEALVNQYGLTSKRPIIVGSFDFYPLFDSKIQPTPESEMFDMQIAASDFAFIATKRMLRRVGFKSISMKQLNRRYSNKIAMAADITRTLDDVHGLIRMVTDDLDIKRNLAGIRNKTKTRITKGEAHTAQRKGGDDFNTQYEPTTGKNKSSFTVTSFFDHVGVPRKIWRRQTNTTTMVQMLYDLHMLCRIGEPTWFGISAHDRFVATLVKFDHLTRNQPVSADQWRGADELNGLEIVPWGRQNDRNAINVVSNKNKSMFHNDMIEDKASAKKHAVAIKRIARSYVGRSESFTKTIQGGLRGLKADKHIGIILGLIAKDIRVSRSFTSGLLDAYFAEIGVLSDVGKSGSKIIKDDNSDKLYSEVLEKITGISVRKSHSSDVMSVLMATKRNTNSLLSSLYVSEKNPNGMTGIDDFGLPFEKGQISEDYLHESTRTLFVNKAFEAGSFGDFNNFYKYIKGYKSKTDDALGALATLDGWSEDTASGGDSGRKDGQLLVRRVVNKIADWCNDIGFHQTRERENSGDFTDELKVEGVRLGIMVASTKNNELRKALLSHLALYQMVKTSHGDFSADLIRSAEDPETSYNGKNYKTRWDMDPNEHIAGSMFVNKTAMEDAKQALRDADRNYYNSIFDLSDKAQSHFFTTPGTPEGIWKGEKWVGKSATPGGVNLDWRQYSFGVVTAAGKFETKKDNTMSNQMNRENATPGNPFEIGIMPQNEATNTIFKLPGKITDMILEYFNENTTVISPATKSNPLARNKNQRNSSVMLSMNYWNVYMIACDIVIELISENLSFQMKYDPAHIEDSAIFKKKKNTQKIWDKVKAIKEYAKAGSKDMKKIASISGVDLYRQVQSVIIFKWMPGQFKGLTHAWTSTAKSTQQYKKKVEASDLSNKQKKVGKHYHAEFGRMVQIADSSDQEIQGCIEFFAGVGGHMERIKRDIKSVLSDASSIGEMKNFLSDANRDPKTAEYMQSISEMQTHNRRHALTRLGEKSKKYSFMPASEVVSSTKIKQILAMMTDPRFGEKAINTGIDNDRIFAIGLPAGMLDSLREIGFTESEDNGEEYARSTHVKIDIFKRDLRDDTRQFVPKSYIFDMSLFATDGKISFDFDLNSLAMKDIDGETEVFRKKSVRTTEPEDAQPLWEEVWRNMEYAKYYTRYDSSITRSEMSGARWVAKMKKRNSTSKAIAQDIIENHAINDTLKVYLKAISGIDLYEDSFLLGGTASDFAGKDEPVPQDPLKSKKGPGNTDVTLQRTYDQFIAKNRVKKQIEKASNPRFSEEKTTRMIENVERNIKTAERSIYFQSDKIKNRVAKPKMFERIFCVMLDPVSDFEELPPDIEDEGSEIYEGSRLKDKYIKAALYSVVPNRHEAKQIGSDLGRAGGNTSRPYLAIEKFSANCFDFYATVSILPKL